MSKSRLSIVLFILAIILIPSYLSANYNLIPSANATGTILYGADTSNLYSIDPTTGLTTLIGPIGTTITGMDFDNTGVLTGIDGNIITINTSTGTGTILFPNATPLPCDGGFAFDSDIATTATDGDKFLCNIFVGQTIFMTSPNPISFDTVNQLNLDPSDTSAFGGTTIGSDDDVYLADQDLLYTFNQPLQSDLTFSSEKPLNFGSFSPDTNCGPISLSFNSSGTLFAVVSCDTNHYLATINTSTGMVSKISTLPGFIAIAFGNPSSVTAPSAPTGLTTTSGNGQVSLSWAAPLSNGGSSITSYNIYRGTSSGGEGSTPYATVSGSTISYTDNGATNGNTYYYIVKAVNSAGTSPASNEASATPTAPTTAPSAPTGLTTTSGNGQVSLSWAAPLSNGGSSITSYNIYRGTSSGGEGSTPYATVSGSTISYTDNGATNGNTYYYIVKAVNSAGTSPASNEASATPITTPLAMKQGVVTSLSGLTAVNNDDKQHLSDAIKKVTKSVDPTLWQVDGIHLNIKKGDDVFDNEKQAVQQLVNIVKHGKETSQFNNVISGDITQLVSVDKNLAQTVITEASSGTPGGDSAKDISQVQKEMTMALLETSKGKYDAAIDLYKDAWKHAQDAIEDETAESTPHHH